MDNALWNLAGAALLAGLAGVVLPLLPGTPLVFLGLWLAAWLDGYARVSVAVVVVLGVLGVLGLVVDYVASAVGVKRAGASGLAVWGAAIGALLGIFAGLPGLILGPIVGAIAGELLARRPFEKASRAGVAAGIGFLLAIAAKLGIAVAMLCVFAFAYFV
jgi:uncharacterized protein YqgC (DUF456 family)